jgi:hypothetical protein
MRIKQFALPLALIVPILLALFLIKPSSSTQPPSLPEINNTSPPTSMVALSAPKASPVFDTNSFETDFDSALALTLLSEIELDENGLPLTNDQLRRQLDNAVRLIGRERAPADLDKLNELVKQAFKLETAEAINRILFQYYAYKIAEIEYTNSLTGSLGTSADMAHNLKAASNLRESYLGHELAEKLFGEEETYHNYMAELTQRLSATDLSETARSNITTEVRKKYYPNEGEPSGL